MDGWMDVCMHAFSKSVAQRKSCGFLNLYNISQLSLPFLRDGKIINMGLLHVIILYLLTYLKSPITWWFHCKQSGDLINHHVPILLI